MTELQDFIIHTVLKPGDPPLCGATDPGAIPYGAPIKILPCPDCMKVGPDGIPENLTMRYHVSEVREALRQKMRGMSETDRATFKDQVVSVASSGLADPSAAPALYDEGQLFAALFAISSIRAGLWHLKRAGIRPTYAILERVLLEQEMLSVALVEGTPL